MGMFIALMLFICFFINNDWYSLFDLVVSLVFYLFIYLYTLFTEDKHI